MTRPETSLRDLVGEEFGPYKLVRRLGIGGMAETFEAIRSGPSGFQQRVCLKLVLPFFQDDENFIELFQREAKLAARLRHSNIVGVIDFGEAGGRYYMALELVDGCDLRTLLDAQDRTRLPWEHVTLIGLDLSAALEHAHHPSERKDPDESGSHVQVIIHRDISPGNVLISRRGEILLTDFGVAKAITGTARKQSTVKGKIPYMSPEQLKGDVVDGRADLFALGVVLFEAMSGRRPYEGAHDPATIMLTLSGEHPSLRELAPEAPDGLCEVIESLLEPDVERRPQTAAVLIESLDDFAPSRRIRRTLGEMVAETAQAAELLARDVSSAVVENARRRAAAGEAPTVRTLEGSGTKSRRRAVMMMAGLVLAIGGVAGVGMLWAGQEGEEGPAESDAGGEAAETESAPLPEGTDVQAESEGKDDTAAAEPAEDDTREAAAPAKPSATESRPKVPPPAPTPARLTVVVFPWGSVWINGKPEGSAPMNNKSMKPGRYRISAGQGSPSKTQTIRLRPGQRKTVQFDLTQ